MDILDERLGVCLSVACCRGRLCVCGKGSFVVEAVQVAASILKVLDPAFWLGDHHVAVKGASAVGGGGLLDVRADFSNDGGAKGDIGHKVAIPGGVLVRSEWK